MSSGTYPELGGDGGECDFNEGAPASMRVVRLAATANVASLSGAATIDGTATANGDRVLLPSQTTASQNGIWVVAAGAWARATDFDATGEVEAGTAIFVTSGITYRYSTWKVTNLGAIDPGTTSLVIKPVSADFDINVGNPGTRAQIGVQALWVFVNGTSSGNPAYLAGFTTTTARFESLADGILMGGVGYKALAATTAWMALHGGQGKPTGVPANLNPGGFPGSVAMRFDVTNKKLYGFDTEVVGAVTAAWHCHGAAYSHLKRATNLTDADQTLETVTDTSSEYCQFVALTANRTKTLGTTSVVNGQVVRILRADGAAFTLAIVNGGAGAGTKHTFASGVGSPTAPIAAWFKFDGTNWALDKLEYIEA